MAGASLGDLAGGLPRLAIGAGNRSERWARLTPTMRAARITTRPGDRGGITARLGVGFAFQHSPASPDQGEDPMSTHRGNRVGP